jgi:hypothetical protein
MSKLAACSTVQAALAPPAKHDDPKLVDRVLIELRIGRLRCAKAEAQLQWAHCCLAEGTMNVAGALSVLDEAFVELTGAKP